MTLFYNKLVIYRQYCSYLINKHSLLVIIGLSFLLIPKTTLPQTIEIDSLKIVASNLSEINKTKTLLLIANKYKVFNYDSMLVYVNKALENAKLINNNSLIIESLLESAYINQSMGNINTAFFQYGQAKQVCIEENNKYLLARVYIDLGRYYEGKSDYAGVISSLDTALNIINENNISSLKPIIYNKIGHLYLLAHDYSAASYYSTMAIQYSEFEKDKSNYITNLLLQGTILLQKNELDSTHYYFKTALISAKKVNNKILMQQTYRKMADYYMEKKQYNSSNIYIDSSILICKKQNLTNELASLITYKAHISSINNEYNDALIFNLKALELRKGTGHFSSICASLLNIGGNYTNIGDYKKAHSYLNRGLKLAHENNLLRYLAYGYNKISQLYKHEGNYKEALQTNELKTKYRDSLITNRSNEKIMFFRGQYEAEKEKTLSEKIKLKKKTNEVIFLIITTLLSIGVIILLTWINYLRKKAEAELKTIRKNLEKTIKTQDKMFSIIAHDLTAPFSSILGFSELIARDFDKYQKEELIRFSQLIYKSSKNANDLLANLLNWSRSQIGSIKLTKESLNIYDIILKSSESLVLNLNKKELIFHNEVQRDVNIYADFNTISVVIRNILSNAIKFTPRGGIIRVKAIKANSKVSIIFIDTGVGIKSEYISGLFDINNKTSKGTENEIGTGLGLILCKEFIELNNGKISVKSTYGEGSIFTLSLPAQES